MTTTQSLRRSLMAGTCLAVLAYGAPSSASDITLPGSSTITAVNSAINLSNPSCDSYRVDGSSPSFTLTCVTGGSGPPTVPSCTLAASPTTVDAAGGSVTLTANCSPSGATPDTFVFSGPNVAVTQTVAIMGPSAKSLVVNPVIPPASFSVKPSANGVDGNSASANVGVTGTTPPPDTGSITCPGYAHTRVIDAVVPENGGTQNRYFTTSSGGFGATDALVVRFQAPANDPFFSISMIVSSGAKDSLKTSALSATKCDFAVPSTQNLYTGTRSTISTNLSAAQDAVPGATFNGLVGGKTYYLNVSNFSNGNPATGTQRCPAAACDVFFTFTNTTP